MNKENILIKWYFLLEKIWFKTPEKIRYILVGGFNTVFAYLVFVGLYYLLDFYNLALFIQYIITINVSFLTMRYYVFRSSGNFKREYVKAWTVYLGMLLFNFIAINLMVKGLKINPEISQAVYIVVSTILIYILHKHFSFKKTV